ncbi:MAG TPA: flagellar biosynthetic protein FliO [Gammaproteobacteria bacterium]|nr:flagellar biosynthetic protein FliO [Gammaproteobacteria bacterium]
MGGSPDPVASALFGLAGFFLLFAVGVALLRWLQKRIGAPLGAIGGSGDVRVLRRFPLGWQCVLLVVEVGTQQYVLATSRAGGVTLLDKLEEPLAPPTPPGAFGKHLKQAFRRQGKGP